MIRPTALALTGAVLAGVASPALADLPVIEAVSAEETTAANGTFWTFEVTLSHPDEGTEHFADLWDIHDMDGNPLGVRVLGHPHEDEQPFTRSLANVAIPEGVTEVAIRARCSVDGFTTETYVYTLP